MNWTFWKKSPAVQEADPEQDLMNAVDQLNEAWKRAEQSGSKLRPWIDWDERLVTLARCFHDRVYPKP